MDSKTTKFEFTPNRLAKLKAEPGKAQTYFTDTICRGLRLRVNAAGSKVYVFQYELDGKTVRKNICRESDRSIKQARAEADRLRALVAIDRRDPRLEEAEEEAKRIRAVESARIQTMRSAMTFGEAWQRYLDEGQTKWGARNHADHVKLASRGGEQYKRGEKLTKPGPIAALLDTRLADISPEILAAWLKAESESRPTSAALAFRLVRAFLNWCEDQRDYQGIAPTGAHRSKSVRAYLPKKRTKDDCLQREQLRGWFAEVRKCSPVVGGYLQTLLLTGARPGEVACLEWEDVDFKWNQLTIRDKVEGARTIPLTPYVASLLQNLKRINETPPRKIHGEATPAWAPSKWVFASRRAAEGHVVEPRIAHEQALAAAGLPHVSLHGLRRSFSTLTEWCEVPTGIVAQIQGHKASATAEKHYKRRPIDMLRMWADKIEAWALNEAGVEFANDKPAERLHLVA